ncbi:MAG: hypothetical protein NC037_05835 [Bacteroides sp.]|nr:hypothetical protein [Bacillota bacterium]MCM1456026.1 hypothetical protein [Bacteroides sp.]
MLGKKKKTEYSWSKNAEKLFRKHKLPAPYHNLFGYYLSISWVTKRAYHGHYEFFLSAKESGTLDEIEKDLYSALPQHLLSNFNEALEKFNALDDDCDDIYEAFDACDDYAFEHEEEIADILKNYLELADL